MRTLERLLRDPATECERQDREIAIGPEGAGRKRLARLAVPDPGAELRFGRDLGFIPAQRRDAGVAQLVQDEEPVVRQRRSRGHQRRPICALRTIAPSRAP